MVSPKNNGFVSNWGMTGAPLLRSTFDQRISDSKHLGPRGYNVRLYLIALDPSDRVVKLHKRLNCERDSVLFLCGERMI